jgi:hypothetical protein
MKTKKRISKPKEKDVVKLLKFIAQFYPELLIEVRQKYKIKV